MKSNVRAIQAHKAISSLIVENAKVDKVSEKKLVFYKYHS